MILANEEIELRPFLLEKDNKNLKNEYLSWFTHENINLISSFDLFIYPSIDFVEDSFKRFTSSSCQGYFIYHKESKKYIGTAKLDRIDQFRRSAEVGFLIGDTSLKNKKIGTSTMNLLLNLSFVTLGLHRVWGGCSEENIAMSKLFKKFGFEQEGCFKDANYISGKYSNHLYFGLLKKDYTND